MTNDQINRACAELCGWKYNGPAALKDEAHGCWICPGNMDHQLEFLPPFTTSLDAAQKAFRALTEEQQMQALLALPDDLVWIFLATPLQWCEAILKAAGKWEKE